MIEGLSLADLKALYEITIFMRDSLKGQPIYSSYFQLSALLLSEMRSRCTCIFFYDPIFDTEKK